MTQQLSAVPIERRRRAAIGLGLMAGLLATIAILPWTAPAPTPVRVLAVAALVAAAFAGLLAWGLARSARLDGHQQAEAALDAQLTAAAAMACDCGHDHLADGTLHGVPATQPACEAAADAPDCPHTCPACVLAELR